MGKYTAIETRFGCIEVRKEKKIDGLMIYDTIMHFQSENDIFGFHDSLDGDALYMLNNGFEIDISRNPILIDYIDANITL